MAIVNQLIDQNINFYITMKAIDQFSNMNMYLTQGGCTGYGTPNPNIYTNPVFRIYLEP